MDTTSEFPLIDGKPFFMVSKEKILIPKKRVSHSDDNFDSDAFETLRSLQAGHFWYMGRRRFIHYAVKRFVPALKEARQQKLRAIDLGGGCGGWAGFLAAEEKELFSEVALADSSTDALSMAETYLPSTVNRYQIDLMDLPWTQRWDTAFLLDVLEHLDDDVGALKQVVKGMTPGGLIFVTMPAFEFLRSYNDDLAKHKRRYTKQGIRDLAAACNLKLVDTRYFNFFLSPLVYLTRVRTPKIDFTSATEVRALLNRTHSVPPYPVNLTMKAIFDAETPLGHIIPFPFGSSVLGVFQVFA
jgi:2-polyprenyl-3-methyl-5-hydroxy-6-metoxy-1,4-benzoquinol methylase